MITVLLFKATRGATIVKSGLSPTDARDLGDRLLQSYKTLQSAGLAVTGVAIILIHDKDIDAVKARNLRGPGEYTIEQYGSF